MKKLQGKPFVIVGVNSDSNREKVKQYLAKEKSGWRSFWDGGSTDGPIQAQWNIQGYPTMYLIDHNGAIVARTYAMGEGSEVIERTVKAAEAALRK
ncbi:MAG: TlpA family protein disulfide reductase [Planctomycetes bacterium]|nr:TlpA family protein disulfide reductase [Planctomycetota bacterium]